MAFNGDEGDWIDPKVAQKMVDNYKKDVSATQTRASFFGINKLNQLLNQGSNVKGLRIYIGQDDKGQDQLVLVAVGADEKNLATLEGNTGQGLILDQGKVCPPYCPPVD